MGEDLQQHAVRLARALRAKGQSVDLVLQKKKMKANFKVGLSLFQVDAAHSLHHQRCHSWNLFRFDKAFTNPRIAASQLYETESSYVQQAERCGASQMFLIAPDEWQKGMIRVKDLAAREERDVPASDYISWHSDRWCHTLYEGRGCLWHLTSLICICFG